MPVSGNEETGFKSVARMSSDYSAGVPIKKRRYPLIRPPSPPFEEQSFGNDSLQKEDSSRSQAPALSNASIGASSSSLSDANKDSLIEEGKGNSHATNIKIVHNSAINTRVKVEEPSLTIHSGSRADVGIKGKLVGAENSANTIKSAKMELNLVPIEAPALKIGKGMQKKLDEKSQSEMSENPGITELSLGIKEQFVTTMSDQNGQGSSQNQEGGEPVSLNLSLTKGESSNLCKSIDVMYNIDGANLQSNRSNWDLNTTMDAWDGSVVDEAAGQVTVGGINTIAPATVGGINTITSTCDTKPLIQSVEKVGDSVTLKEKFLEKNKYRSDGVILPNLSGQPSNSGDNLYLGLGSSFLFSNPSQSPASSSAMANLNRFIANSSLHKQFELPGSLNKVNIKTVKSEPFDGSMRPDFRGAIAIPKNLVDPKAVKFELVDRCNPEALKSLNYTTLKLVDPRSIKPEPVHEEIQQPLKEVEGTSNQSDKEMQHAPDFRGKTISSADLSTSSDVPNSFEHSLNIKGPNLSEEAPQENSESATQVLTETMPASVGHDSDKSNVSGVVDTLVAEDKDINDSEKFRSEFLDEVPPHSLGNDEDSVSDEEKINLSGDMLEEDSYSSDYESDANHNLGTATDAEQDGAKEEDFEDGEVREPLANTELEGPIREERELLPGNSSNNEVNSAGIPCDYPSTSSYGEDKHTKTEDPGESNIGDIKESAEIAYDVKTDKGADNKGAILHESLEVETPTNEADKKRSIRASPIRSVAILTRKDGTKGEETEKSSDQAADASQGNSANVSQGSDEVVKKTDVVEKNVSALPRAETSLIVDDAAKDGNSVGSKSRIINLPRASNMSSPGQTRTFPGRPLPSQAARERLPDVAFDGDNLHPRGRDEFYADASHKFPRERHLDQSSRNPRLNFVRGRGRISSRIDTLRTDWDSERDFAPEIYNEFHVPRHKYASEPGPDFNSFNVGLNGTFIGTGRGGRKLINNEAPVFRHMPPRRRSPGGREGPPGRGIEMVRRGPRNISPSGCIGEDGSELVGLRRGEKFMRGLPNDNTDQMYPHPHPHPHPHPQPPFEGLDGHFVRGNRNFLSMQRRGIPRIRSKSPIGSRTRSPGTWASPRRRSPDGFGGHPDLPNRRSPPIYRMERMRSPDHSCFPGEMVVRRHGSPYMSRPSNELRDMDSGRDPRAAIPNRSPSGRVLLRNTRRFDIVDPRERTDNDDYFGRPMHSGRFQELGADGTGEERRRFGERRGLVRSFRPPYNGTEGESFHLNAGDHPRPFRFCPEDDSEFHDRGNLREREFDRRIKNRPGNAPRRTRNIEEQEGNYRHGGQVWHDNGFDDMSRIKRKRF